MFASQTLTTDWQHVESSECNFMYSTVSGTAVHRPCLLLTTDGSLPQGDIVTRSERFVYTITIFTAV